MKEKRVYNFSAGPSMLSEEVLEEVQKNLLNYHNSGMSVMEMSHRSSTYLKIYNDTKNILKRILNVPDSYNIVFVQGGATQQFSMIPLNLLKSGKADYIITGSFSNKAYLEACKYGDINIVYDGSKNNFTKIPNQEELNISNDSDYLHYCTNNTIYGTEWKYVPKTGLPLVADMSSNLLSKPIDVSKYSIIYAGAQKNMGIAGLGVAIIKNNLLNDVPKSCPILLDYSLLINKDSMYNTPPTFSIYMLGEVCKWIERKGGLEKIYKLNLKKANILYDYVDNSLFYKTIADKMNRSIMNVTFRCPNQELDLKFASEANQRGLTNLSGHRSVGGLRASIYNAMPVEGVVALINFMKEFEVNNNV